MIQVVIYLIFLLVLLFHWNRQGLETGSKTHVAVWTVMIFLALIGCAMIFVIANYVKNVMQYANVDVAGVHNKKALEKKLAELEQRDDIFDIGIMMFDLNNLKKVNDNFGHEQGDLYIKNFAAFLTRILTENSFLARYGGDEFVIIEEHTDLQKLAQMNQRLQGYIDNYNLNTEHKISYAVGYDVSYRNHYYVVSDLMRIADEKMYADKKFKKQNQSGEEAALYYSRSDYSHSVSIENLAEKIHTILNNNRGQRTYAFLMTDIKDFRLINDYWGYDVGNRILETVLARMEQFRESSFSKRFHSDTFAGIVDYTGMEKADFEQKIAEYNRQIEREVQEKFSISYFSLRTGIYYMESDDVNPADVISHANTVRHMAKEAAKGIAVYDEQVRKMELRRAEIINSFPDALADGEICLYFQPKVNGKTEKVESAEVLVRWKREDDTVWTPDQFLPVLEETEKILDLDYYVYAKAFQWLSSRKAAGKPVLPLSLNVSPAHFKNMEAFETRIRTLRETYKPDPALLVFEITETAYIHNMDAVNEMIQNCHKVGIQISMDDFGSGYSSLNLLKDILFDEVKIDKRFLDEGLSTNGKIVLEEIFHLLKRTQHSIVCEGVETREVADFLIQEECDQLQGYFYYKPMEEAKFEALIQE